MQKKRWRNPVDKPTDGARAHFPKFSLSSAVSLLLSFSPLSFSIFFDFLFSISSSSYILCCSTKIYFLEKKNSFWEKERKNRISLFFEASEKSGWRRHWTLIYFVLLSLASCQTSNNGPPPLKKKSPQKINSKKITYVLSLSLSLSLLIDCYVSRLSRSVCRSCGVVCCPSLRKTQTERSLLQTACYIFQVDDNNNKKFQNFFCFLTMTVLYYSK